LQTIEEAERNYRKALKEDQWFSEQWNKSEEDSNKEDT